MRLSTIKLAGFKSFVEPSKIPFPDQMTCVVGPNGCGKSNVIDAVRWVLGESSAKNLRGDAMTDVIFNGSSHRKPVSQASVELIFDNTAGKLPGTMAARNQISIKRLVTRDAQSFYYLNGVKCRKRDITDIFLGTGLGPRSYAIIEQGMISRLIESKPQDLRIFLEEAAGVSKYKERRKETQTRLNSTKDNLERLLDLRKELAAQLETLNEQAASAKKYTELKQQERLIKAQLCVVKWQQLQKKLTQLNQRDEALKQQSQFLEKAQLGFDDVIESLKLALSESEQQLSEAQNDEYQIRHNLTRFEQQKIHNTQQKQQLIDEQKAQQGKLAQLQSDLSRLQKKEASAQQGIVYHQQQFDEAKLTSEQSQTRLNQTHAAQEAAFSAQTKAQQAFQTCQKALHDTQLQVNQFDVKSQGIRLKKEALAKQVAQYADEQNAINLSEQYDKQKQLKAQLAKIKAQLENLQRGLEHDNAHYQKHSETVTKKHQQVQQKQAKKLALSQLFEQTDQAQGTLLNQLVVEPQWQLAVENSLFSIRTGICIEQFHGSLSQPSVWQSSQQKVSGSLACTVQQGIYPSYFNRIGVAQNQSKAERLLAQDDWLFVVTPSGELFGENWYLPAQFDETASHLVKLAELKDLNISLQVEEKALKALTGELDEMKQSLVYKQAEHADATAQLHQLAQQDASLQTHITLAQKQDAHLASQQKALAAQMAQLTEQAAELSDEQAPLLQSQQQHEEALTALEQTLLQAQSDYHISKKQSQHNQNAFELAKTQLHTAQLALEGEKNQLQLLQNELARLADEQKHLEARLIHHSESLEALLLPLSELDEKIITTHQQLEEQLTRKAALSQAQVDAKQALLDKQDALGDEQKKAFSINEKRQQLALDKQSHQLKSEAALAPLRELNFELEQVRSTLTDNMQSSTLQNQLAKRVNEITQLGAINLAAIEEYDKAHQRKRYLDEQYQDLTTALTTLEGAIVKIDRETKARFKHTFDQVNQGLQELFPKVFGGGAAYLELTSNDLLDTGVAIMARPPGKKNSTIHLLSGGEKALTALSLVFSIFRLNPAPFCMLDEVDAPLDDANVARFCRLVEEMSNTVQFIYISHNKIAMEMAARLTGVTMAEPGVSRVVAVDIATALEMADHN